MEESTKRETPEPQDGALVKLPEYLPGAFFDLRYAGTDNFTGRAVYDFDQPRLRYGTVKKLQKALAALNGRGCSLLIWDAYRPVEAQFRLWEICPDPTFVADPRAGFSDHSRGSAVDLTLCTLSGEPLEMPSGFDDFSPKASRDYRGCTKEAAEHARLLEKILTECGFVGYPAEWWHYNDADAYGVIER